MTVEKGYRDRYESGNTPWDVGFADFNLIESVTYTPIAACKALDVGCGTGDNSIWLATNGFEVVGTDVSDVALNQARDKAAGANANCDFRQVDFLRSKIDGAPFGFIFDRGCFHSFTNEDDRNKFAKNAAEHLAEGGLWLTIAGNADEDRQGPGPPQRTARDIVLAVEPYFEILILQTTQFGSKHTKPPRAWRGLFRKRS